MQIGVSEQGLGQGPVDHYNLSAADLIEHALRAGEGVLASNGAFCAVTAPYTGRSPGDKFIVDEPESRDRIDWGKVNQPISVEHFDRLREKVVSALDAATERFIVDCHVGAAESHRVPLRVISERAWVALFAQNMFVRPQAGAASEHDPSWVVLHAPTAAADPDSDGTNSEAFVVLHPGRQEVIIGGTAYAGEVKKSMFTVMNYLMPLAGVFPMHCSANVGSNGASAVFFGLSGTGKTTLSADPRRTLVGDDEHGWSEDGIFNFEGGCYAKVINLSAEGEPEIWDASNRFGAILENVVVDKDTRNIDFEDATITENTRSSYPIEFIPNASDTGTAGHPTDVVFLTADAYGVLPPISKLTAEQASYWFLAGYTAKVAGTERGVTEPQATFSACFGSPFLPLPAGVYAEQLAERVSKHSVRVWLVNTGWTGGQYGTGSRMKLKYTRAMLNAALEGRLDNVEYRTEDVFGLAIPTECPDVPSEILNPRETWDNPGEYDEAAEKLAAMFRSNFARFADSVSEEIRTSGPS